MLFVSGLKSGQLKSSAALEHLAPYTEPGAAVDSGARDPPPKCHPGTRLKILGKLTTWLDTLEREWNMMWLHGPAGTGKSAVAQTFAEHCSETGRLGAAFFFSRPNDRNTPETVIPTLAYQLAIHCRSYNSALTNQLTGDPQLLKKAPRVQLRKLIIEPFLFLQAHETTRIKEPFIVILDGLDECEGERAQFEFVSMVNEASQLKDIPLLWLICSRPEAHLHYTFSRVPYCGREELLLDKECRDDVDRYLRDELATIREQYSIIMPSPWPSKDQFDGLSGSASGLFVFASTGLKYIGDPTYANPIDRLKKLLSFLNRIGAIGSNNPLASLDLLYTQILTDVPEETFPTTWRILAHSFWTTNIRHGDMLSTAQLLRNFLHLDQGAFYSALRKLHSVIAVPVPEEASKAPLRLHHASFQDFLSDPNRSGRFVVERGKALFDIAKSCLFWHDIDVMHFHADDGWGFDLQHRHASLPHLKWVSPDNEKGVSRTIASIRDLCWDVFDTISDERDDDLLSLARNLDFRYLHRGYFPELANWVYRQDPSDPIIRTEPSNELDMRLLKYMRTVIGQGPVDPATFPINQVRGFTGRRRVYFYVGHGEKTIIAWFTECRKIGAAYTLGLDKEPSLKQVQQYQDWLIKIKWNDTIAGWREVGAPSDESSDEEDWDSGTSIASCMTGSEIATLEE
ncbi:hypothetical protein P691DRAFT_736993 [Macrolepiota fuliginosa MF-IS2]|uniref:Nephrocystin 3-like N-terminal domain-containing protein n=1 Tax=Macrolepiota fuliginosa MF-IS2 TaxID=1400762 RepID=A0A9P6BXK3_9AGAR|nr:hypothetical protein P691DRAFT_736993 [Macrolepiota fuliginosa MF-IS2]